MRLTPISLYIPCLGKDEYTMGGLIEKSILGTAGVCGCELVHKADADGYSSVDVNEAIKWQRTNRRWLGEKGGEK